MRDKCKDRERMGTARTCDTKLTNDENSKLTKTQDRKKMRTRKCEYMIE